jgi:hypothetical protein
MLCEISVRLWKEKTRVENVITSVVLEPVLIAKLSVTHISTLLLNTKPTPNFSLSDNLITEGDALSLWFVIGYLSADCGMSNS